MKISWFHFSFIIITVLKQFDFVFAENGLVAMKDGNIFAKQVNLFGGNPLFEMLARFYIVLKYIVFDFRA